MSTATDTADTELKARHRAIWGLGDYPAVAREVIAELGPILVEAAGIAAGTRVLDVVASDLCPDLLAVGEKIAAGDGVALRWEEADAEALPYATAEFDAVVSCLGVMFAPHHQASADELLRVLRPGGTLGLINWTASSSTSCPVRPRPSKPVSHGTQAYHDRVPNLGKPATHLLD